MVTVCPARTASLPWTGPIRDGKKKMPVGGRDTAKILAVPKICGLPGTEPCRVVSILIAAYEPAVSVPGEPFIDAKLKAPITLASWRAQAACTQDNGNDLATCPTVPTLVGIVLL